MTLTKRYQPGSQEVPGEAGRCADPDRPGRRPFPPLGKPLQGEDFFLHSHGLFDQTFAVRRQRVTPRQPVEQACAQILFQRGNAPGDGRVIDLQLARRR